MTDQESIRRILALRAQRMDNAQYHWPDLPRDTPEFRAAVVDSIQPYLELFADDAVVQRLQPGPSGEPELGEAIKGRDGISEWILASAQARPPGGIRLHMVFNTVIDVGDDAAEAVSDWIYLWKDTSQPAAQSGTAAGGLVVENAGKYYDRLVKRQAEWLISHFKVVPLSP